jgi:hypothetical protein
MNIPLDDKTLFGNDAGEDEDESVLVSYFVDQPAFAPFLDPHEGLRVATGRKGTGKSALLVRFAHDLRRAPGRPVVLHLLPSSLAALKEPPATDNTVVLENYWKQVICAAINMELAQDIGFAWNDDQIALVESAEVAGFKGKNLVSALLSRLITKFNVGGIVDLTPTARPTASHEQLLNRLTNAAGQARPVWLLMDDIDTNFQNSPAQRAYIATFFSVARTLRREISGLSIRATVRSDVWSSLSAEHLDKVEQYMTTLQWSASLQKTLLARRVSAYIRRNQPDCEQAAWPVAEHEDELIDLVFAHRMKWGGATAPASHVLRVLGGGRPRWMAQLCRQAGVAAAKEKAALIGIRHINQVMAEFGARRLADLYKEHGHQFTDLKRLVEAFSGGPRRYATDELLQRVQTHYLALTPPEKIPAVDGTPWRDARQLAHFLFKCGFINGNNKEGARIDRPEFVSYDSRPDLLQVDTNLDDGMAWEIQPAYRGILNMVG